MHSVTNPDDTGLPDAEDTREGRSHTSIFPFKFGLSGLLPIKYTSSFRDTSSA